MDPFWREYGEQIGKLREAIFSPITPLGEKVRNEVLFSNRPTTSLYTRLSDIIQGLIFLYEVSEGAKLSNDDFFNDPVNQQLLIRAFALYVEDVLKRPYNPEEKLTFEDYRQVLEKFLKEVDTLKQAYLHNPKKPFSHPDIVGTLTMILCHVTEDVGLQFKLNPPEIRNSFTTQNPQDKSGLRKVFEVFKNKVAVGAEKQVK